MLIYPLNMVMFRYVNVYTGGIGPSGIPWDTLGYPGIPWDTLGYPAIKGSVRRSPMKELDLGKGVDLREPNFVEIKTNINHQTWVVNLVEPV